MSASKGGESAFLGMGSSDQLEAELARANARLRELDHRIKNDLQLIGSVLVLQLRGLPAGPEHDVIRAALERVTAVSAVHRRLDVAGDPSRYEASGLVRDLAEEIAAATRREDVRLRFDLWPTVVPARQAAPLALITGELVRNALRHAFPGRPGEIEVSLGPDAGLTRLAVRDDGVGTPAGGQVTGGFGMKLVALLAQQLRGTFEMTDAAPGMRAVVRFPEAA